MKVVVQNGANHCLRRKDAEAVVRLLPDAWRRSIRQLVLFQGDRLGTSFYPKESVLYLCSPPGFTDKRAAGSVLIRAVADICRAEPPEGLEESVIAAVSN